MFTERKATGKIETSHGYIQVVVTAGPLEGQSLYQEVENGRVIRILDGEGNEVDSVPMEYHVVGKGTIVDHPKATLAIDSGRAVIVDGKVTVTPEAVDPIKIVG